MTLSDPWSLRVNLVPTRTFRGQLLHKQETGRALFRSMVFVSGSSRKVVTWNTEVTKSKKNWRRHLWMTPKPSFLSSTPTSPVPAATSSIFTDFLVISSGKNVFNLSANWIFLLVVRPKLMTSSSYCYRNKHCNLGHAYLMYWVPTFLSLRPLTLLPLPDFSLSEKTDKHVYQLKKYMRHKCVELSVNNNYYSTSRSLKK